MIFCLSLAIRCLKIYSSLVQSSRSCVFEIVQTRLLSYKPIVVALGSFMLSRLGHSLSLSSKMDVQIQLDKREATYTNQDTVSGRLILHARSSVDISGIQVTLSGSALSRLHSGRRTESHQAGSGYGMSAACANHPLSCFIKRSESFLLLLKEILTWLRSLSVTEHTSFHSPSQ
jgi:hypothetical protein